MSYNSNIPAAGQTLGETRSPIQTNFSEIQTDFSIDHVPISAADGGKHNQVTLPEQASDPTPGANEIAIYSKESGSKARPFIRYESSGVVKSLVEVVSYGAVERVGGTVQLNATLNNFNFASVAVNGSGILVTLSNALIDANYNLIFGASFSSQTSYTFAEDTGVARSTTQFKVKLLGNGVPLNSLVNFPKVSIALIGNFG